MSVRRLRRADLATASWRCAGVWFAVAASLISSSQLQAAPSSLSSRASAAIPIAHFARLPDIRSPRLSPKGDYLAAIKRVERDGYDKDVLTVFHFPSMEVSAHLAFPGRNDVGRYAWANDDRLIVTVSQYEPGQEQQANYGELFSMNADGSRRELILGIALAARARAARRAKTIRSGAVTPCSTCSGMIRNRS